MKTHTKHNHPKRGKRISASAFARLGSHANKRLASKRLASGRTARYVRPARPRLMPEIEAGRIFFSQPLDNGKILS